MGWRPSCVIPGDVPTDFEKCRPASRIDKLTTYSESARHIPRGKGIGASVPTQQPAAIDVFEKRSAWVATFSRQLPPMFSRHSSIHHIGLDEPQNDPNASAGSRRVT